MLICIPDKTVPRFFRRYGLCSGNVRGRPRLWLVFANNDTIARAPPFVNGAQGIFLPENGVQYGTYFFCRFVGRGLDPAAQGFLRPKTFRAMGMFPTPPSACGRHLPYEGRLYSTTLKGCLSGEAFTLLPVKGSPLGAAESSAACDFLCCCSPKGSPHRGAGRAAA